MTGRIALACAIAFVLLIAVRDIAYKSSRKEGPTNHKEFISKIISRPLNK